MSVLCSYRRTQFQFFNRLQDLFRTRSNSDAFRQIDPANDACRIDEEFSGTDDVSALGSRALVQKTVTLDCFRLRVRKKRIGEAQLLAVRTRGLWRISADRDHADTTCIEIGKALLETPQLGVAERSPVTAIENQQDAVGLSTRGAVWRGREDLCERHRLAVLIRQGEPRRFLPDAGRGR